jgi:hypothetical protein
MKKATNLPAGIFRDQKPMGLKVRLGQTEQFKSKLIEPTIEANVCVVLIPHLTDCGRVSVEETANIIHDAFRCTSRPKLRITKRSLLPVGITNGFFKALPNTSAAGEVECEPDQWIWRNSLM